MGTEGGPQTSMRVTRGLVWGLPPPSPASACCRVAVSLCECSGTTRSSWSPAWMCSFVFWIRPQIRTWPACDALLSFRDSMLPVLSDRRMWGEASRIPQAIRTCGDEHGGVLSAAAGGAPHIVQRAVGIDPLQHKIRRRSDDWTLQGGQATATR